MDIRLSSKTPPDGSRELEIQKRRLRENCREFESVMVSYLMKSMKETVIRAEKPEPARDMYEDMLAGQISKEIGKSSGLGLGEMLYKKLEPLLKTQHAAARTEAAQAVDKVLNQTAAAHVETVEEGDAESISLKE